MYCIDYLNQIFVVDWGAKRMEIEEKNHDFPQKKKEKMERNKVNSLSGLMLILIKFCPCFGDKEKEKLEKKKTDFLQKRERNNGKERNKGIITGNSGIDIEYSLY